MTNRRPLPLPINLGIDFGTSWTKLCYRDLESERTGVVRFEHLRLPESVLPSVVQVDGDGLLFMGDKPSSNSACVAVRYLKMRLARAGGFPDLPVVAGVPLSSELSVRALSAWYLSRVIVRARYSVLVQESELVRNRQVQWSANVGVPVEQFKNENLDVFDEVLRVAWEWAEQRITPTHLNETMALFQATVKNESAANCHAVPEIVAAILSFSKSRSARDGLYLYFDIGGGTLDGVGFELRREAGEVVVHCKAGNVADLGVEALVHSVVKVDTDRVSRRLLSEKAVSIPELEDRTDTLHTFAANVIMPAKQKHEWGRLSRLPVFLGGGAAGSHWYQHTLAETHKFRAHGNCGIPPYDFRPIPEPADLIGAKESGLPFARLAIAYGLSFPREEVPEFSLPEDHVNVSPPRPARLLGVTSYVDT